MRSATAALCAIFVGYLLTACGEGTADLADQAQPLAGCSDKVGEIIESKEFTPWDARLTHSLMADEIGISPIDSPEELPEFAPRSVGGLPVVGAEGDASSLSLGFADLENIPTSRSEFLSSGGILLYLSPDPKRGSIVEAQASDPDTGHRVVLLDVGTNPAALTWADPDHNGVRAHHLIWSDGERIYNLQAVRPAEDIVSIARDLAC